MSDSALHNANSRHTDGPPEEAGLRRWNFAMFVMESSAFQTGIAWTDPSTVLPLFIGSLSGSPVLVGLVMVLQRLGWMLPQLPIAALVSHRPHRRPFLRWGVFFGRLPFLVFVVYLWTRGISNPSVVLTFMLLAYFAVSLGNGVVGVPWQDIIAKSIPARMRGRFFGTMQFTTGIAIFGVGFLVRWLLGPGGPAYPKNYFILFTLCAAFITWSTVGCWMIKEPIRPVRKEPVSLRDMLRGMGPLLRAHPALLWVGLVGLLGWGLAGSVPYYMLFAKRVLEVQPQIAGVYIWAATLGGAAFSLLWAYVNDSRGPRAVIRGTYIMVAAVPLLALSVPALVGALAGPLPALGRALPNLFAVVFLAAGAALPGMWMGPINYLLELAGDEDRPRYIAVFNTLSVPGALVPLLLGWLLGFTPFQWVFVLMSLGGVAALAVAWRMPEPGEAGAVSEGDEVC